MGYFDDAKSLIEHAKSHLSKIESAYQSSLSEKAIDPELLVEIKNFMENLRSALDFSAHGLFAKYGSSTKTDPKIYFPYALLHQSQVDFRRANRIETCIPGVSSARPDITAKLESFQHFADPKNAWLPAFMELNNENKHQQLTPQIRKEKKELRISSRGAQMRIGPGASISIGKGASIRIGDMDIPGGQSFDSEKPPKTRGPGKKEIITWVSFRFSTNDEPVLPFLKKTLTGIEAIVQDLEQL